MRMSDWSSDVCSSDLVMPPVIDGPPWLVMGPLDDPAMLAQDLALGGDDEPVRVDPQAHRPVGERGWHAVAIALEGDQAGRRYPLGVDRKSTRLNSSH